MSLTEAREVVTPDRRILMPAGESILREVAREYGITVADIRGRWNGHWRTGPAKIEAARRMLAEGMQPSKIARIMRRNSATISWYLGRTGKARQPANLPNRIALGSRQSAIYDAIGREWMTPKQIARRSGMAWDNHQTGSRISRFCHSLEVKRLVEKGGMPMKPLWRRAR